MHKREVRMFFSEEKNQKTFISPQLLLGGHGRKLSAGGGRKSLLVLFFRKEHSSFSPSCLLHSC
jgi:hypothetical protein